MAKATHYPRANRTVQSYVSRFTGSAISPNVVVLHTTEGTSFPTYSGGAVAPNLTARPNFKAKRLDWREHFPLNRSARALVNKAGGVETNSLNCVQVELVGTCAKATARAWESRGLKRNVDFIYWPEAPEWALRDVADLLAFLAAEWGLKLQAPPTWRSYPDSYGNTSSRLTASEWQSFYGVCGHQHVPENVHGDPGDLNIARILQLARGESPAPVRPAADVPKRKVYGWTQVTKADAATGNAVDSIIKRTGVLSRDAFFKLNGPDRLVVGQWVKTRAAAYPPYGPNSTRGL